MGTITWVVLGIAVIFLLVFVFQGRERKQVEGFLSAQAQKRGGQVVKGTPLFFPRLLVTVDTANLTVSAMAGGGAANVRSNRTYVECELSCRKAREFSIKTREKSVQMTVDQKLTSQLVKTADLRFDERFFMVCEDEGFIRRLLSPGLRKQLMGFSQMLDIDFTKGKIHVSILEIASGDADYDRLIDFGAALCEAMIDVGECEPAIAGASQ